MLSRLVGKSLAHAVWPDQLKTFEQEVSPANILISQKSGLILQFCCVEEVWVTCVSVAGCVKVEWIVCVRCKSATGTS